MTWESCDEKMTFPNPFKPTAGAEPPVLIGRDRVLRDFADGIDEGVGSPARLMRITGPRGSGKTVLLTEVGDIARERGWRVVDVTANEGIPDTISHILSDSSTQFDVALEASVGFVKARGARAHQQETLRDTLTRVATELTKRDSGLLITVDEIQDAAEPEVRELAVAVQHLIRERLNIAFVFAGITTGVLDLINGKALTFLRRAKAEELGAISLDEVQEALLSTIVRGGLEINTAAVNTMAKATGGYAYLIQLIGYHVWSCAREHVEDSRLITQEDVRLGIEGALKDFNLAVHEPALADLPLRAIEYALAMTEDSEVSSTNIIAQRVGVEPSSLTSYRRMLIRNQVIEPTARGYVAFSIPYMREYLIEHKDEILSRFGAA